jgi:hypothetical protein
VLAPCLPPTSIAGSFFGAKTVGHSSLGAWGILAMVCFALCLGAAIWILLPHAFVFAFQGEELLAQTDHHGESNVTEAYRSAGIWMEPRLPANGRKIADLCNWLGVSCALLATEVILWTTGLIG